MVRIDVVIAKKDLRYGKFYFKEGNAYFSRMSKDGSQIIIKDENDRWYSIINRYFTLYNWMQKKFNDSFTIEKTYYVKNYKEAREITGY